MRINRRFTLEGKDPYNGIKFRKTSSEIRNPDGSVVFSAKNISVPEEWSQVACDILAQKYFRKAQNQEILHIFVNFCQIWSCFSPF